MPNYNTTNPIEAELRCDYHVRKGQLLGLAYRIDKSLGNSLDTYDKGFHADKTAVCPPGADCERSYIVGFCEGEVDSDTSLIEAIDRFVSSGERMESETARVLAIINGVGANKLPHTA